MEIRSLATAVFAALEKKTAPAAVDQTTDDAVLLVALRHSTTRCDQIMQRRLGLVMPDNAFAS